jgi:hypothetical protein
VCIYDKHMRVYDGILLSRSSTVGMDMIENGKRMALEHKMDDAYLLAGGVLYDPKAREFFLTTTPASGGGLSPAPAHGI